MVFARAPFGLSSARSCAQLRLPARKANRLSSMNVYGWPASVGTRGFGDTPPAPWQLLHTSAAIFGSCAAAPSTTMGTTNGTTMDTAISSAMAGIKPSFIRLAGRTNPFSSLGPLLT
jgi:hypothetical protein